MAWIAQIVFFGAYTLGYIFNETFRHNGWTFTTALAAGVITILLIVDNHGFWDRRP